MRYLILSFACLFLVSCSSKDSEAEQDAAAHKEAEALFNETKKNYGNSIETLLGQIGELVEHSKNYESRERKEKLEPLITFSFPQKKRDDLFPTYENTNSLITRFAQDGTKNERPKNGFNEFSELSSNAKKFAGSYSDSASKNAQYSKKEMQNLAARAAHYSRNLKYIFILRETENTYPRLLSGGKFRQGSFRGDLLLFEIGNNEPLAVSSVNYSPPETVLRETVDVGVVWKLDCAHTETIEAGICEAMKQMGSLDGAISSYTTYSPNRQ